MAQGYSAQRLSSCLRKCRRLNRSSLLTHVSEPHPIKNMIGVRSRQEPPGAARSNQERSQERSQEPPGAARECQEPPGISRSAATSKARSRQEPPGAARNRSSRQGNQEQPGIPNYLIRGTVVYVGPCQSWEPNLC